MCFDNSSRSHETTERKEKKESEELAGNSHPNHRIYIYGGISASSFGQKKKTEAVASQPAKQQALDVSVDIALAGWSPH